MDIENISRQNQVIISLLGRITYPEEKIKLIITKRKRNPSAYIKGYNACDGERGVTEIAKIVGVSQPTMTCIFQDWNRMGIVYHNGRNYVKLYTININKEDENEGEEHRPAGENSQEVGSDSSPAVGASEASK